ncbi:hypothetical protein TNCV_1045851 [Trichonephila clavipes]|nr:hypothetical protein TNCV_1045851 [Trichonephila clavipes]
MRKHRERVKKKIPDLQSKYTWILHQDNSPVHIVPSVKQFLEDKRITVLEHPPYSTDLAPYDFYLFLKGKHPLMGTYLTTHS